MTRRERTNPRWRRAPLVAALLAFGCHQGNSVQPSLGAPVVLVTIDTLRADHLPLWGYSKVQTPAIDALGHDGVLFSNAYAQVPLTLPSHASLLTGLLPYEDGVRSNTGFRLDTTRHATLPALLKRQGYTSGAAVSAYVLRRETGIAADFDHYDDSLEVREGAALNALQRPGGESLDAVLTWLNGADKQLFFLWLHLYEPHTPYEAPEPYRSRYSPYDAEIAAADAIVGRLVNELKTRGLYDRSLFVLTADHGEGLGDHGEAEHGVLLYRETLHVPLIVKLPKESNSGQRVDRPVGLFDIAPTILELVGAERPAGLSGVSLFGQAPAGRRIYSETLYPRLQLGWSELRSLIDGGFHFIGGPDPELYDLAKDPAESTNLRDGDRRTFGELRAELETIPLNLEHGTAAATPEERKNLASLGYLSGVATTPSGPLADPKRSIQVLADMQTALRLAQESHLAEAEAACRAVLAKQPNMVDARIQLGSLLRRLGRADEAREEYREVVRRSPEMLDTIAVEMGKIALEEGHLDEAAENAKLALAAAPDEAHLLLAGVAIRKNDWAGGEREATAALGNAARPRIPALILLARVLIERGRLDEARTRIENARGRIARGEAKPVVTLEGTYADILGRQGHPEEAEASFRREIEMFPESEEAYVRFAILLASEHRFAEIQPTLDHMVTAKPIPTIYELAAQTMSNLGNEEGARQYRQTAARLFAKH
ncbi:MAG: sulfatase-like hydrolase/transferase [Acidobacteriota bacterium]